MQPHQQFTTSVKYDKIHIKAQRLNKNNSYTSSVTSTDITSYIQLWIKEHTQVPIQIKFIDLQFYIHIRVHIYKNYAYVHSVIKIQPNALNETTRQ